MRAGTAFLVMVPMLLVTLLFVSTQGRRVGTADAPRGGLYWDEGTASWVRQRIASTYVDTLDARTNEQAYWRALDAYVRFDPYCDVIPPAEYRQWKENTAGQYGGLGIRIDPTAEGLRILGALPSGPAARAGLVPGDLLVSADGRSLGGLDLKTDAAARMLKGAPGVAVRLLVRGPAAAGAAPDAPPPPLREVVVVREIVKPPVVFSRRVGERKSVGVIHISEFAESTAGEFDDALNPLLADASLEGLVLDLRDNAGGVLAAAVHVVDRFLPSGVIVRMEGRAQGATRSFSAQAVASGPQADVSDRLPVVVLVNGFSASASEVVAGALQDHRRALLVGERTYGKFLVQQIIEAPRGDCALQLVTSRYYTPSGRSYQRRLSDGPPGATIPPHDGGLDAAGEPAGLLPDVVEALGKDERARLHEVWDHEEDLCWGIRPGEAKVPLEWVDPQLERGLEVLRGELLMRKIRPGGPADIVPGRPR